ncbi:Hypothetical protein, putative [Bodo saltans]|uniref:Uncharacterized protein n=1 Tax=Bodo saltans TaxID=75058 RepID=A0A0S4JVR3_BODSA|nr:Hypothetical protein, putative [Bodo saltans]|eukprot:CUG93220.1 Hypothetical protein, putative [Bodo saltans]
MQKLVEVLRDNCSTNHRSVARQLQHQSPDADETRYDVHLTVGGRNSPLLTMIRCPIIVVSQPPQDPPAAAAFNNNNNNNINTIQPQQQQSDNNNNNNNDDDNTAAPAEPATTAVQQYIGDYELSHDSTIVRFRCRWFFLSDDGMYYPLSFHVCHRLDHCLQVGIPLGRDGERDYFLNSFVQRNRESLRSRPLLYCTDMPMSILNPDDDAGYEERFGGTAVCGKVVPTWSFFQEFRGNSVFTPLDFESSERLEAAFQSQEQDTSVVDVFLMPNLAGSDPQAQLRAPAPPGKYKLTFHRRNPGTAHARHIDSGVVKTVRRDFPSWLFLHDKGVWCPIDAGTATLMTMAAASGHTELNTLERKYDLVRFKQTNNLSGVERPLLRILSTISLAPEATVSDIQTWFPNNNNNNNNGGDDHLGIADRLTLAVNPDRTQRDIDAALRSGDRLQQVLAVINIFVVRFGCIVKGGIVRDAVVLGDVSQCKDIDVEVPIGAKLIHSVASLEADIDRNIMIVLEEYGLVIDSSVVADNLSSRGRFNTLGGDGGQYQIRKSLDALSEVSVEGGIFTLSLKSADKLGLATPFTMDVECVTHWNHAYHPPRNIDFSSNNLRLIPKSTVIAAATAPGFGGGAAPQRLRTSTTATANPLATINGKQMMAIYQSVPIGMSTADVIAQILVKKTCPVYDVEFVPKTTSPAAAPATGVPQSDNNTTFEAADGVMEVVVRAPTDKRHQVMLGRLGSMQRKGYSFVPLQSMSMAFTSYEN